MTWNILEREVLAKKIVIIQGSWTWAPDLSVMFKLCIDQHLIETLSGRTPVKKVKRNLTFDGGDAARKSPRKRVISSTDLSRKSPRKRLTSVSASASASASASDPKMSAGQKTPRKNLKTPVKNSKTPTKTPRKGEKTPKKKPNITDKTPKKEEKTPKKRDFGKNAIQNNRIWLFVLLMWIVSCLLGKHSSLKLGLI